MGVLIRKVSMPMMLMLLFTATTAQALSWAYAFVVWNGNVYEVMDENLPASSIGKKIGEVKTVPNDMTGRYYGDASNVYPKGTEYYAIDNISAKEAIAVKTDGGWIKAVFVHKAPFHLMNYFPSIMWIAAVILLAGFFLRFKRK